MLIWRIDLSVKIVKMLVYNVVDRWVFSNRWLRAVPSIISFLTDVFDGYSSFVSKLKIEKKKQKIPLIRWYLLSLCACHRFLISGNDVKVVVASLYPIALSDASEVFRALSGFKVRNRSLYRVRSGMYANVSRTVSGCGVSGELFWSFNSLIRIHFNSTPDSKSICMYFL